MSHTEHDTNPAMYEGDIYVDVLRLRRINNFLINACLIGGVIATAGACLGVTGLLFKRQPGLVALSVAGETGRAMLLRRLSANERPLINPKGQAKS